MFPLCRDAPSTVAFLLLASSWAPLANALDIEYCASFNTGSTPRNSSIYQTNGLCHDFCIDDYAFAITQDKLCWCSNYVPSKSTQEDTSKCDIPCPAWPSENCGGDGLYGYVSLGNILPSGTQGPSASSTKAKPTVAISKVTETVQNTVTVEPTSESSSSEEPESSTTEEEETSTSTEEESSSTITTEADPTTSLVQTVTAGGTIKTVTIAPTQQTADTSSASDNTGETSKKSGLSTGEVVGVVVGVIAGVIGTAAILLFFWFRRKKERNEQEAFHDDPSIRDSSSGIAQRPDMSMAGGSPVSAAAGASNRDSALQIDPRMDPFKQGLYVRSASHESINTLRDDHDYSRKIQAPKVLRATNPDPVHES
ncbi:cell wall integrity and stress response component [Fusarium albosuccineum]|uniref:Cell wall integrity and stress response component n=1 Tax=Fusarium albosuccineum TaxID=1237068 RepID=A0A8H4P913_9HYPO|nr:cell wall integrity and stress response component [Fusarium albosuccineum]